MLDIIYRPSGDLSVPASGDIGSLKNNSGRFCSFAAAKCGRENPNYFRRAALSDMAFGVWGCGPRGAPLYGVLVRRNKLNMPKSTSFSKNRIDTV